MSQKTLVKTIKTANHNLALAKFKLYNGPDWPDCFATITKTIKKEGGDKNKTVYVVKVYELSEKSC